MKQIIHDTIRVYCLDTFARARLLDYAIKNGAIVKGYGIGDRGTIYVLMDSESYLPLLERWNEKQLLEGE